MEPIYLGVDVAGAKNTWVSGLSQHGDEVVVVHGPRLASLGAIVDYCAQENVVAATIDAQLTIALSEENGFRTSDMELKELLKQKGGDPNWVSSINSLMAVPVRGRLLADHLSPILGTLLETHPRASLLFALGEDACESTRKYKGKASKETKADHTERLWRMWSERERFGITHDKPVRDDGELDSLVCATVAYLYHRVPEALYRLRHDVPQKTGRGPFYVLVPDGSDSRNA